MSRLGKVSVAIVSWNGRRHLADCLGALREQADPGRPWEVLLLDNGSRDGSAEWVERHHPEVRLVRSPVNVGFCRGNNLLVDAAEGDAVAFLNNDTRARSDWLRELVRALEGAPAEVAAVSGQIVDWPGERLDFARGAMTFDGHAFQLDFGRPLAEVELPAAGSEMFFPCGGNMLVRRDAFLELGGFDEAYFAYLEDVDLGWRLQAAGRRVLFAPDALVHHRSAATSDRLGVYHRGFLFERNAFLTAFKNYEDGLWERVMPAVLTTLLHRTQALLRHNNPGGEQLALDPYAGLVAETAPGEGADAEPRDSLWRRWRRHGTLGAVRRALVRLGGYLVAVGRGGGPASPPPALTDPRTVAQLRAVSDILRRLDALAGERHRVQAGRRRPDLELLERFPVYLVPTYPGDEALFAGAGFGALLPPELPLVRRRLEEVERRPDAVLE